MKKIIIITLAMIISVGICIADKYTDQFLGYWVGTIRIMENEIECQLEFLKSDGKIKGFLSIPIQGMKDFPVTNLVIDKTDIFFEITSAGVTAFFSGSHKETYISGTFEQQGRGAPFHFVRGEKSESQQKLSVTGESLTNVKTNYGNIYGSLVVPEAKDKVPLVIIIAGSGPTDRNGNNPLSGEGYIYRNLAMELRDKGIASLRYDKRGIGQSAGAIVREQDIRFEYFVQDVIYWVKKYQEDSRFSSIILLGHSEGSLIALLAAQREKIAAVISVAGMGRPLSDVMAEQLSQQPEPHKSEALQILNSLKQGAMVQEVSKELLPLFRPEIQPFLLSMMKHKPTEEIAKLDIPVLILQGTTDLQVKQTDAEMLHKANKDSKMVIIKGMNHVMRTSTTDLQDNFRTYGNSELPFSDGFIENIIAFIEKLRKYR